MALPGRNPDGSKIRGGGVRINGVRVNTRKPQIRQPSSRPTVNNQNQRTVSGTRRSLPGSQSQPPPARSAPPSSNRGRSRTANRVSAVQRAFRNPSKTVGTNRGTGRTQTLADYMSNPYGLSTSDPRHPNNRKGKGPVITDKDGNLAPKVPPQVKRTTTDINGRVVHHYSDGRQGYGGNTRTKTYQNNHPLGGIGGGGRNPDGSFIRQPGTVGGELTGGQGRGGGSGGYGTGGGGYGTGGGNNRQDPGGGAGGVKPPPNNNNPQRPIRPDDDFTRARANKGDDAFALRENEVLRAGDRYINASDWANQMIYRRLNDLMGQMDGLRSNAWGSRNRYDAGAQDLFNNGLRDSTRESFDTARGLLQDRINTEGSGRRSDFWNSIMDSGGVDADAYRRASAAPIRAGYDNIQGDVRNAQRIQGSGPNAGAAAAALTRNRISDLGANATQAELSLANMQNQNRFAAAQQLMGEDLRGDDLTNRISQMHTQQAGLDEDARARGLMYMGDASKQHQNAWLQANNAILGQNQQYLDNENRLANFRNIGAANMYAPLPKDPRMSPWGQFGMGLLNAGIGAALPGIGGALSSLGGGSGLKFNRLNPTY